MNNIAANVFHMISGQSTTGQSKMSENSSPLLMNSELKQTFLAQFNMILHEAQAEVGVEPPIGFAMLETLFAEQLSGEEGELLQKLESMVNELSQQSEEFQQRLVQSEDLQQWLMQTSLIVHNLQLQQANSSGNMLTDEVEVNSWRQAPSQVESILQQLQQMMQSLTNAKQQHPNHGLLKQQEQALTNIVMPLIAATDDNKWSQRMNQLLELFNQSQANPDKAPSMNTAQPLQWMPLAKALNNNVLHLNGSAGLLSTNPVSSVLSEHQVVNSLQQAIMTGQSSGVTTQPVQLVPDATQPIHDQPLTLMQMPDGRVALETQPTMQAKPAAVPIQAQHFTEEMTPFIIRHMKFTQLNGISEAKISLVPENLGQVDVRISMQNGQLTAQFLTETLVGREMLEGQLSQLRAALQSQGIQIEKLEVAQSNNTSQSQHFQEPKHQQSSKQFQQQSTKIKAQDYASSHHDYSMDLEQNSVLKYSVYGSSFDVMA